MKIIWSFGLLEDVRLRTELPGAQVLDGIGSMKGRRIRGAQRYYPTRSRNFRCRPPYRPPSKLRLLGDMYFKPEIQKQTHFHQSALTVRKIGDVGREARPLRSAILALDFRE